MKLTTPTSPDAEQNLLGGVIIDPGLLNEYDLDRVPEEAFYNQKNRIVWRHVCRLYWNNQPIEIPTVIESLRLANELNEAGTANHVLGLAADMQGTGMYAEHYANTLMESWRRRQLLQAAQASMQEVVDQGYEAGRDAMLTAIHEIDGDEHHNVEEAAALAEQFVDGIEGARLPTGYPSLDRLIGGFPMGDLTIMAGRTSMGKSALAHNIAFKVQSTHVLTPDQPLPEILVSEACRRSKIPYSKLREQTLTDDEKDQWRTAFEEVKGEMQTTVTFDDRHLTFTRMVSEVRRAARRGKKLVIIDHVQHVKSSSHKDKRHLMMDVTGTLKGLARDEGVAVLALSQLTRDIDHRFDKRPNLVDLSESKTLEEDANVVLFLYRDGYYNPGSVGANLAEVIIGKSKTSARLSMAQLLWVDTFMSFEEIT